MRVTHVLYILLFSFFSSQAQDVSGIVVNGQGEPISGAMVLELGTQNIVRTDAAGKFKLPSKNTFISSIISSTGYQPYRKIFRPNDSSRIVLKETEEEDIPVFTFENRIARSKRAMRDNISIELTDIKFQGVALNAVVDQPTSFAVKPSGRMSARSSYSLKGMSHNKKQFFIDGVPVEYFGGHYTANYLPVSLVDRVEINTNTNPTSFITDHQGDAINLRTKLDFDENSEISYSMGSFNTHQVALNGYARTASTGFTFRGSVFYNYSENNYEVWGDDIVVNDSETGELIENAKVTRFNDAYHNAGAKVDLGVTDASWADQFFLSAWFADKYDEVQHGATMKNPYGERFYRQEAFMPSLTYQKTNLIWKGFDLKWFGAYSIQHRDITDVSKFRYNWLGEQLENETPGEQEFALQYINDNRAIHRLMLDYKINDEHAISLSNVYTSSWRKEDNKKAPIEERTNFEKRSIGKNILGVAYKNKSLDHSLETAFFGKLMGYKVHVVETDYNEDTEIYEPSDYVNVNNKFGFGVAVNYTLHPNWLFQSTLEKAATLPVADELFGNAAENVLSTIGTEGFSELKPEESINTKVNISYKNNDRNDHRIHVGGQFLMRKVKNYIQQSVTSQNGFDYFIFENHKKIMSSSFELQLDYRFRNSLDVSFSTGYTSAINKAASGKDGGENKYLDSRLKNEPYFQMNSGLSYHLYRGYFEEDLLFTFSWSMRYVHEFLRTWQGNDGAMAEMIPTQFINNFGVNYRFPNESTYMSIEARNVFNEQVFDKYALQLPGRGIYFKLGHNF